MHWTPCRIAKSPRPGGGAVAANLRQLTFKKSVPSSLSVQQSPVKLALLNTRSLTNKTFILNDMVTSHNLNFLFLTETWLNVGDLSPFGDLCPPNFAFLNSPRTSGRGGGLATIYNNCFKCRLLPVDVYTTSEVQMLAINVHCPVLCALVYRPPKYSSNFISEFSDFLSHMATLSDNLLILGDFDIHVCCPTKPMVSEFLSLLDSFNLSQAVSGPTHYKGHTLDLVLFSGFHISNMNISNLAVSDHLLIEFETSWTSPPPPPSNLPPS